jgi:hypothetical protein
MRRSSAVPLALALALVAAGAALFWRGVFPSARTSSCARERPGGAGDVRLPACDRDGTAVPHVVLIVVDGLAARFVLPPYAAGYGAAVTPWLSGALRDGRAAAAIVDADPPTVTLPRIKALTSGTVPGFLDVVLNFDAGAYSGETFLSLSRASATRRRRHVFCGDDTWLRLFPDAFDHAEGVTSFFVADTREVDDNVTRCWDAEWRRAPDADAAGGGGSLTVLHYLGVDHAGHLSGASSALTRGKVAEVDAVVQRVVESVFERHGRDAVVLLASDHGMTEDGNHGGNTADEREAVLVAFSARAGRTGSAGVVRRARQVDVAPTVAALLGVRSPRVSVGVPLRWLLRRVLDDAECASVASEESAERLVALGTCLSGVGQRDEHDAADDVDGVHRGGAAIDASHSQESDSACQCAGGDRRAWLSCMTACASRFARGCSRTSTADEVRGRERTCLAHAHRMVRACARARSAFVVRAGVDPPATRVDQCVAHARWSGVRARRRVLACFASVG